MIKLENISKQYDTSTDRFWALKGVSLQIDSGEFVSIMGASGSGKSTLMNIIGCLDTATSGIYKLDEIKINLLHEDEITLVRRQKIGFVFQGFNLLPRRTVSENISLPLIYGGLSRKVSTERAIEAMSKVGLSELEFRKPAELSGGQQQRVAIARALVSRPRIILADEPTGNLDSKTSNEIMNLFRDLNESNGITILIVTHESDVAAFSKRTITIKDGKVISDTANSNQHV